MSLLHLAILAVVQGLTELLPVSSSAHVVVAEKLMGLDPSSPPMTLLLVMLHTGTMFAVIVYFFNQWRSTYFQSTVGFKIFAWHVALATALTGLIGEGIIKLLEHTALRGLPHPDIEDLFSHLELIAPALAVAGFLILSADIFTRRRPRSLRADDLSTRQAAIIGFAQGLSLPFRGFSRSGSTISAGMLAGTARPLAESFSFALAVVLTPPVVARELMRLVHNEKLSGLGAVSTAIFPSLFGAVLSFFAGLIALKWLSQWLEGGRWYLFGIYCLFAAAMVATLHHLRY
jgi:undecaprenyl-diphosphatase